MNDERGDGAQMGVASGWVGLSLWWVVGFGGRVRGGKPSTNGNHELITMITTLKTVIVSRFARLILM